MNKLLPLKKSINSNNLKRASFVNLTNSREIRSHIQKIFKKKINIGIKLDDDPMHFNSTFVGISSEKNEEGILIGMLLPVTGLFFIRKSKKVAISYSFEKNNYSFEIRYLGTTSGKKFDSVILSIPSIIRSYKRKNQRAILSNNSSLKVNLGNKIIEEVDDLSLDGLCFYTLHDKEIFFRGKTFSNISFVIPIKNYKVCTKAIVQWFIQDAVTIKLTKNKCGIQFINIKDGDKHKITQYISKKSGEKSM